MTKFQSKDGFSIISLIIPQARFHNFLPQVLENWPYKVIQFDCRGTLTREQWFLPTMSPECEYLQFIVNDLDVPAFMDFCIEANDLHLPGSGAIFNSKCSQLISNAPSTLSHASSAENHNNDTRLEAESKYPIKKNLYAFYAMIQSGRTENAIKAAMQAGSHGPLVYFVEGLGIRDLAGWLRITKKPYEEVIIVLVEEHERARVTEALVSAGGVNNLGGGIVFDIPVAEGLINLPTSTGNRKDIASNDQIATAIDQLMGSANWRDRSTIDSFFDKNHTNTLSTNTENKNTLLNALMPRKYASDFLEEVLAVGVAGANINYTKLFSKEDNKKKKGLQIHHELVQIKMVLSNKRNPGVLEKLQAFCEQKEYRNVTLYENKILNIEHYYKK